MNNPQDDQNPQESGGNPPIVNLPPTVTALIIFLVLLHLSANLILSEESFYRFLLTFGFAPLRLQFAPEMPGGVGALFWTPFTHGFLHADWMHLIFNVLWLAVFGTPIARRYGPFGFAVVFGLGLVGGVIGYLLVHYNSVAILIGASGAVSALMGGALRFMYQPLIKEVDKETGEVRILGRRLATPSELLKDQRAVGFTAVWMGVNVLFGVFPQLMGMEGANVAWEAHISGFVAGFFAVAWLERRLF
ncbi:hypothetical protein MXMO3_01637 [Maritalea myrionectae]|uniref:Peptidase S54 rhomboid domain-containing protein n=1 Tax=Maritalea myrionectae TaxID=454601 RepID=A0A2R4ME46_9HYPH|nr:rhomboid family intramembrane serine protease [Maritalea myrionectae]AVX04166.1 hypothetical protein MXMO3_01637 [Maritalea myrionectae]